MKYIIRNGDEKSNISFVIVHIYSYIYIVSAKSNKRLRTINVYVYYYMFLEFEIFGENIITKYLHFYEQRILFFVISYNVFRTRFRPYFTDLITMMIIIITSSFHNVIRVNLYSIIDRIRNEFTLTRNGRRGMGEAIPSLRVYLKLTFFPSARLLRTKRCNSSNVFNVIDRNHGTRISFTVQLFSFSR